LEYKVYTYGELTKGMGLGDDNIYSNGEYYTLKAFLQRGDVIFDVGANRGQWTSIALCLVIPESIYCFEPVPVSANEAKNLHVPHTRVTVENKVVGNQVADHAFLWYKNSPDIAEMSNLFGRPDVEAAMGIEKEQIFVSGTTIDHYCKENDIDHINFMKVDTEGAEFLVIDGSNEMLEGQMIDFLQFEYGGCFISASITLKKAVETLSQNEYSVFRIVPDGLLHLDIWQDEMENYIHSNYLAVSSKKDNRFKPTEFISTTTIKTEVEVEKEND